MESLGTGPYSSRVTPCVAFPVTSIGIVVSVRDFVKRVIGIPGDIVEIHEGQVRVNEIPLNEPYVTNRDSR